MSERQSAIKPMSEVAALAALLARLSPAPSESRPLCVVGRGGHVRRTHLQGALEGTAARNRYAEAAGNLNRVSIRRKRTEGSLKRHRDVRTVAHVVAPRRHGC